MMCLLKRVLPFALTLTIGVGAWILIGRPQSQDDKAARDSAPCFTANSQQAYTSTDSRPLQNPSRPLAENERALLGLALGSGYGSADCNVVDIELAQSTYYMAQWDGNIYRVSADLKDAKLLKVPKPSYWKDKDASDGGGIAMLRVTLSATGEVTNVVILSPTDISEEHVRDVVAAAKLIQFKPATEDGIPGDQDATILYKRGY